MCDFAPKFQSFDEILKIIKMAQENGKKMNDEENGTQRWVWLASLSQDQLEDSQRCPEHLI
jgi:hypothetical protein